MGKPRNDPLVLKDQDENSRCRWKMVRERHDIAGPIVQDWRSPKAGSGTTPLRCDRSLTYSRRSATPGSGANTDTGC